jgi:hypothetical protein
VQQRWRWPGFPLVPTKGDGIFGTSLYAVPPGKNRSAPKRECRVADLFDGEAVPAIHRAASIVSFTRSSQTDLVPMP